MSDDVETYRFGIPLEDVFLYAISKKRPVIKGHRLSKTEQATLAVCLWTFMKQNAPLLGEPVCKALEARWPDVNWSLRF